ncbi:hypothetical protein D3C80_1612090 [compost metagenome]
MKNIAPALIPKTLGEARGFRVNACINAPAIARLAPITVAITALSTLVVRTII